MTTKYLDSNGLTYLLAALRPSTVPADLGTASAGSSKQFAKADHVHKMPTASDVGALPSSTTIPSATTTTPKMNGTAAVGTETKWAKGDHVHPSDTRKVDKVAGKGLSTNDFDETCYQIVSRVGIDTGERTQYYIRKASGVGAWTTPQATEILYDQSDTIAEWGAGIETTLTNKVDKVSGKGLSTNDYTTTEKDKLANIASGAEVNQNAFSNIKVGATTVAADGKTDTLELVAGSNVTLTPDATNDKVTIAATDTTYSDFTGSSTSAAGTHGLVPAPPQKESGDHYLLADSGDWKLFTMSIEKTSSYNYLDIGLKSGTVTTRLDGVYIREVNASEAGLMTPLQYAKLSKLKFDSNNLIDSSILPSYVDDVIEAYPRSGQTALSSTWLATGSASGTVITPETGKIYVLMADSGDYAANTQFRWGGTAYVKLSDGGVSSITNAEIDTIVAA